METCPHNQNVEMELKADADNYNRVIKEELEEETSVAAAEAITKEIHDPANSVAAAEAISNDRVTIKAYKSGHPKGYAYVQFLEEGAVQNVLLLNKSVVHYRQLKVTSLE